MKVANVESQSLTGSPPSSKVNAPAIKGEWDWMDVFVKIPPGVVYVTIKLCPYAVAGRNLAMVARQVNELATELFVVATPALSFIIKAHVVE